jgi:hypothetical protein
MGVNTMKKAFLYFLGLVLATTLVAATDMVIQSDTTNQYWDGSAWQYAVYPWNHDAWDDYFTIDSQWIWKSEKVSQTEAEEGVTVTFLKEFDVPECTEVVSGSIDIAADNGFKLYVNGNLIKTYGWDYENCTEQWTTAQQVDLTGLQPGKNNITIEVMNWPPVGMSCEPFSGTPETNPAGLIYKATISYDGQCEVPEFGGFAAGAAVAGSILGLALIRRRF